MIVTATTASTTWGTITTSQTDEGLPHDNKHHTSPNSKSERNLIILQVNINGLKSKLEELKLLIHDTHSDIITIQETKLTPSSKHQKYI